jgi:hypothetical protein
VSLHWKATQDPIFGEAFELCGLQDGESGMARANGGRFIAHAFVGGRYLSHCARSLTSAMKRLDADISRRVESRAGLNLSVDISFLSGMVAYRNAYGDTQMTETTDQMLARIRAMPHTHKVVTTYADGKVREFTTRSLQTAEHHAVLDRRNIGRRLMEREFPHRYVTIVKVEVVSI